MKPTPELLKLLEQGRQELADKVEEERQELRRTLQVLQDAINVVNRDWLTTVRQCINPALADYIVVPNDNPFERIQNEYGQRRATIEIDGLAPIRATLSYMYDNKWKLHCYVVAGIHDGNDVPTWSFNHSSTVICKTLPLALAIAEERFVEFKAAKEKS